MADKMSTSSNKSNITNEDLSPSTHHLVWLDKQVENDAYKQKLSQLSEFDDHVKFFTREQQAIDYIRKQNEKNTKSSIIFIAVGSSSEDLLAKIHDCPCIHAVFILCTNTESYQYLKYAKLRAVCTDQQELFDRLRNCVERDKASMDFSLFNAQNVTDSEPATLNDEQYPIRDLKEDQARFLWFYECHHFMIELEHDDKQAKEEMIASCRRNIRDDKRSLNVINEFEEESVDDNAANAIYWYSQNSIIFRFINEAIVSGNISTIYSYRYFIKILCRQLKDLHEKYKQSNTEATLRLYRGQRLKESQILLISKHVNDLISFNGFVSTTLEKDVAKRFCYGRERKDYEPVMFIIDIDMTSAQSTAFADISHISRFPDEEEILLSIGSIFRIESVTFDETKRLYQIHLSLSQHDKLTVNKYIEQTFAKECDASDRSVLFGKLLFDMGEYQFAIDYFQNGIKGLTDRNNHYRPIYLNNIGVCYNETGQTDAALRYYKAASQIYQLNDDRQGLGTCYQNIASLYYRQREYGTAQNWTLKALQNRQQDPLEKASTLNLLGCIKVAKHNAEAAGDDLREALRLRVMHLGRINPNHPDIGISYQNLGRLDVALSSLIDAQNNYLRAEQIFRHNYPKSHPLVREIRQCLEDINRQL